MAGAGYRVSEYHTWAGLGGRRVGQSVRVIPHGLVALGPPHLPRTAPNVINTSLVALATVGGSPEPFVEPFRRHSTASSVPGAPFLASGSRSFPLFPTTHHKIHSLMSAQCFSGITRHGIGLHKVQNTKAEKTIVTLELVLCLTSSPDALGGSKVAENASNIILAKPLW